MRKNNHKIFLMKFKKILERSFVIILLNLVPQSRASKKSQIARMGGVHSFGVQKWLPVCLKFKYKTSLSVCVTLDLVTLDPQMAQV